jgi:hypothetical protein
MPLSHLVDYMAQEIPASASVAGKELAKKETT